MSHHILIFDSGLGGLTVLQEIYLRLPSIHYSYLIDDDAFPYGNKTDDWLIDRASKLFAEILPVAKPDIIVVACNTASTLLLEQLRQRFSVPIIGVVPAIKPAAEITRNRKIGLLATRATINREYIDQLQAKHAANCQLYRFDCQSLVAIAEDHLLNKAIDQHILEALVKNILDTDKAKEIDTMVLGCTHFPALKHQLAQLWPHEINWIDSGAAIARRTESLCLELQPPKNQAVPRLYHTKSQRNTAVLSNLGKFAINQSMQVSI